MNTTSKTLFALSLILSACAGGELESDDDAGSRPVTTRGDTGGRGTTDTGAGTTRDLGGETIVDVATDATDDAGTDAGATDADSTDSDAGITPPWAEIPAETPAPIADAIRASRTAMLRFCECCSSRYADDPQLCLVEFNDGGFEPDQCRLDALGRSDESEGYLGCLVGAYVELNACQTECGASCSLCENNLNFSRNRCASDYPSVVAQLELCP